MALALAFPWHLQWLNKTIFLELSGPECRSQINFQLLAEKAIICFYTSLCFHEFNMVLKGFCTMDESF